MMKGKGHVKAPKFDKEVINDVVIKAVKPIQKPDPRPVRGAKLFPELYCNCFILGKKKSGKSSVLYRIVEERAGPETTVIAFGSTIYRDDTWLAIRDLCEKDLKIPFEGHLKISDNIHQLLSELSMKAMMEEMKRRDPKKKKERDILLYDSDSDSEDEDKPRKSRSRAPEYLIIFDDISDELKHHDLLKMIPMNRHWRLQVYISSQYWNHMAPSSRLNMDYILIFPLQPIDKLENVHESASLSLPFDDFLELYQDATSEPHNFLYIDTNTQTYRHNFNLKYPTPTPQQLVQNISHNSIHAKEKQSEKAQSHGGRGILRRPMERRKVRR